MKKDKHIIILDFETGNVYTSHYDTQIYEDFSDFLLDFNEENDLNIRETNSQWMIVDELNIKIL